MAWGRRVLSVTASGQAAVGTRALVMESAVSWSRVATQVEFAVHVVTRAR